MIETPEELLKRAEAGDKQAQVFVSFGYAVGEYGFRKDYTKLRECAEKGWKYAKAYLTLGYVEIGDSTSIFERALNKVKSLFGYREEK